MTLTELNDLATWYAESKPIDGYSKSNSGTLEPGTWIVNPDGTIDGLTRTNQTRELAGWAFSVARVWLNDATGSEVLLPSGMFIGIGLDGHTHIS